jgi:hypothetical protein
MSSGLPTHPNLEHLKKQARERLRELRVRVPGTRLADAQHVIAREYGFASWPKLKAHVDAVRLADRVLAVHLREIETDALLGVALLVPSQRYAATLIHGFEDVRERKLTPEVWQEIDQWVINGDVGLPAEPVALSPAVVTALLGYGQHRPKTSSHSQHRRHRSGFADAPLEDERLMISAHRFASFPFKAGGEGALTSTVKRLLPRLRDAWRPRFVTGF